MSSPRRSSRKLLPILGLALVPLLVVLLEIYSPPTCRVLVLAEVRIVQGAPAESLGDLDPTPHVLLVLAMILPVLGIAALVLDEEE